MFKFTVKAIFILFVGIIFCVPITASPNEPVTLLLQAKGKVEYRNGGKEWKRVHRNKFLFEGYRVRTGSDGSCKLLNEQTNTLKTLTENSEVEIHADGAVAVEGGLSEEQPIVSILGNLKRKFVKVQRYTVVLRSAHKKQDVSQENVPPGLVLSQDYPDLVWENSGAEYSYRLIIGDNVFDVPAADGDTVRFRLPQMKSGGFAYKIQVLRDGNVICDPLKSGTLYWMSDEERNAFQKGIQSVREIDPDNGFLIANYMDEQGISVAAMDLYRKFFRENPDTNEMRPFLIKVYHDLDLEKLKKREIALYNREAE
jgi:hypothetical protein